MAKEVFNKGYLVGFLEDMSSHISHNSTVKATPNPWSQGLLSFDLPMCSSVISPYLAIVQVSSWLKQHV